MESKDINYSNYEYAKKVLSQIVKVITDSAEIKTAYTDEDGCTVFEIYENDPGIVIGKHGHTLDAIQYIFNMIMNKGKEREDQKLFIIDIDGYRKRREDTLKKYAREKAEIVKRKKCKIELFFMNSIERRIIHLALKDNTEVRTRSEGIEPFRRIIIEPV